jgi:hypothetical protein
MLEYFFKYEIQHHKESIIQDCNISGCYGDIPLIETICMMHKTAKLRTYTYVDKNPFIHVCMQKIILNILCSAIKKKNVKYIFKVDGDDQMDVRYIKKMKYYLFKGADYIKGNRFKSFEFLKKMPLIRIYGNLILSFICKISSGYYFISDCHNGFIGGKKDIWIKLLKSKNISKRYFFEPDLLYNLYNHDASIKEISMPAVYKSEKSNLNLLSTLFFPLLHLNNFFKRVAINYYFKEFNLGSLCFLLGFLGVIISSAFLISKHLYYSTIGQFTPTGTLILGSLSLMISFQILVIFFILDYLKGNVKKF